MAICQKCESLPESECDRCGQEIPYPYKAERHANETLSFAIPFISGLFIGFVVAIVIMTL